MINPTWAVRFWKSQGFLGGGGGGGFGASRPAVKKDAVSKNIFVHFK